MASFPTDGQFSDELENIVGPKTNEGHVESLKIRMNPKMKTDLQIALVADWHQKSFKKSTV